MGTVASYLTLIVFFNIRFNPMKDEVVMRNPFLMSLSLLLTLLLSVYLLGRGYAAGPEYRSGILDALNDMAPGPDVSSVLPEGARRKVILDTDPALGYLFGDVDDALMLAAALADPRLEILGITVGFGNAGQERSYLKAREIVDRAGRPDIPVLAGSSLPGPARHSEASRFIVSRIRRYPGEVTILATGALTNLAAALDEAPELTTMVRDIVLIGGHLRWEASVAGPLKPYDLNLGSDPECARFVLGSGFPVTVMPIELGRQFLLDRSTLKAAAGRGEMGRYLLAGSRSWFLLHGGQTVPWDLVGLYYLLDPGSFDIAAAAIRFHVSPTRLPVVVLQVTGPDAEGVRILTDMADQEPFWDWFGNVL